MTTRPESPAFDRPIFIIGCNRSGTTLLFRTLSAHPLLWTRYEENQHIFHRFFPIDAELGEAVPTPAAASTGDGLVRRLYVEAHNKEHFKDHPLGRAIPRKALQTPLNPLYKRAPIRFVDKTPANSLRIPLLADLFPDARFLLLVRRPEDTISSLMEGWSRGLARVIFERDSSIQDPKLLGARWHYLVPPGWTRWRNRPLEEVCAFQWVESVGRASTDLRRLCPERTLVLRHEDALERPAETYRAVFDFCGLPPSRYFDAQFPVLQSIPHTHGGSAPAPEKWRMRHEAEIESVRPMFDALERGFYGEGPP